MNLKNGLLYPFLSIGAVAAGIAFLVFLVAFVVSVVAAFWQGV